MNTNKSQPMTRETIIDGLEYMLSACQGVAAKAEVDGHEPPPLPDNAGTSWWDDIETATARIKAGQVFLLSTRCAEEIVRLLKQSTTN